LLVYLGGAERPPILRVYVDENPIEEDHNLEEDQQDMLNDEFDDVDMNNHNSEIGKNDVLDLRATFLLYLLLAATFHFLLNHHM